MIRILSLACLLLLARPAAGQDIAFTAEPVFDPPSYVIYRTTEPIATDGRLDEVSWAAAPWTDDFVDIEGADRPAPRLRTRAKLLWDDRALYVAAELEEPDVWASFTERDTRIYLEDAFEVFTDPDGDTHDYLELEVNALGTIWDLFLTKPYRDGGTAVSAWDIRNLGLGVAVAGTVNDPSDEDVGWTVELALPWNVLAETAPGGRPPAAGDRWRLTFARSEWPLVEMDGAYEKRAGEEAEWWVWAPQGAVDMHRPERFGYVQFANVPAGSPEVAFNQDPNEQVKWALRLLYYRQWAYREATGRFADRFEQLNAGDIDVPRFDPELQTTQSGYEITAPGTDGARLHIRDDGRVWATPR